MKTKITQLEKTSSQLIFLGSFSVTIFMLSGVVTDPVNAPKFFILGAFGFSSLLVTSVFFLKSLWRDNRVPFFITITFILSGINAVLFSETPLTQNLYGNYGRNTGFLAYLALSGIFLLAISLSQIKSFELIVKALIAAGVVNVIYCAWVFIFGDFMGWNNTYNTFLGTFGNPNFIGSFLSIIASILFAFLLKPSTKNISRILFGLVLVVTILEMIKTNVMQGKIVLAIGLLFVLGVFIKTKSNKKIVLFIYSGSVGVIGLLALLAMFQRGPLAHIIYQYTFGLRVQYWRAGINTGLNHLLNGVGFDGLGDWYRRMRTTQSLITPGVDVTINTSHNVFIDMFAFGGLPLLISYVLIVGYTFYRAFILIKIRNFDFISISLIVAWLGYQAQSLISINQLGLAIWGWVLAGGIIGYSKIVEKPQEINQYKKVNITRLTNEISPAMVAGVGFIIGSLVTVPPLSSDMNYRAAQLSRSAETLQAALIPTYLHPQNTNIYLSSVISLEQAGLHDAAYLTTKEALNFNVDSYETWKVLYFLKSSSATDKSTAERNLIRLDPKNPDVTSPPK